jgi:glycosyltransferase involved in cell wall biosynthesis
MHLAIVSQFYPAFDVKDIGGGIEAHHYNFARACVRLGHQVTVISTRLSASVPYKHTCDGITVFRIRVPNLHRFRRLPLIGRQYRILQSLWHSARACRLLGNIHRANSVNIAEFAEVNAEAFFWQKRLSRRLAVRCHTPNFVLARYYTRSESSYDFRWLGKAECQTIRKAHILTTPSHDMARVISDGCRVPIARFHSIPNAVEPVAMSVEPRASTPITVLFVGRLERVKGVDVLLEAIPRALQRMPAIRFVIAGGSRRAPNGMPYQSYLQEQLASQISNEQVVVTGFVSNAVLETLYAQAHIAVVPSLLYESFSFTVAQAMMRGIPVVASRIGGIPETLDYGRCGVLVEPNDPQTLANAIVDLAQDAAKREQLGQAAREHALAHYSSDVVAKRILEVYEDALG